jgi:hypothetical protein
MTTYSDQDKLRSIRREISMRRKVYPRWVAEGRMTQEQATRELEIFEQIASDYESRGRLL